MKLRVITKSGDNDMYTDVKFHSFEKNFLVITNTDLLHNYIKIIDILSISEYKD